MRDWRYVGDGAFVGPVALEVDARRFAELRRKQNLGAGGKVA